jgi:hypothetical protein
MKLSDTLRDMAARFGALAAEHETVVFDASALRAFSGALEQASAAARALEGREGEDLAARARRMKAERDGKVIPLRRSPGPWRRRPGHGGRNGGDAA